MDNSTELQLNTIEGQLMATQLKDNTNIIFTTDQSIASRTKCLWKYFLNDIRWLLQIELMNFFLICPIQTLEAFYFELKTNWRTLQCRTTRKLVTKSYKERHCRGIYVFHIPTLWNVYLNMQVSNVLYCLNNDITPNCEGSMLGR